jgi:hypothetical protein
MTEEFFGQHLSDEECEALMIEKFGTGERVFKKHFSKELRLMSVKWFDYRIMHPVVATYKYAHEYIRVYQRYYKMTIDCERGNFVKGFKGGDAWLSNQAGGFIKGRQIADSLGMPYDLFISMAFNFLYIKKWKHLPRPCHLYAEDTIQHIEERWHEHSRQIMTLSKDPYFKNFENIETPEMMAHQEWINRYLNRSRVRDSAIECLIEQGYLIQFDK